jgi:hypothetical protein
MASANFPDSPVAGSEYVVNGTTFLYRVTSGVGEFVAKPNVVTNLFRVESISALRTTVYSPNIKAVLVPTVTDPGLGGAWFIWDPISTVTDDGATVVKVTTVTTGRWVRVYDGLLDARSFGWPGDGTAVSKMRTAATAANTAFATTPMYFALPKNSSLEVGQIRIHQGPGGVWGTGNNNNLSIGQLSFENNTTGYASTCVGYEAGRDNTSGFNLTSFGTSAGRSNTTGINNTALGVVALQQNTTGNGNTAVGVSALVECIGGNNNTAVGFKASFLNAGGSGNTAVGTSALLKNTSNDNTAVGFECLTEATGTGNTAVGKLAGGNVTSGTFNTAVGTGALFAPLTGNANTAVGANCLMAVAAISNNTAVGYEALRDTTAGGNTALGYQAGISSITNSNCTFLGAGTAVTGSNQVQLGNSATTTYVYNTVASRSDARDKADVRDTEFGLDFINALRPVDYKWDMREDYRTANEPLSEVVKDGSKKRNRFHHGFIAQEIPSTFGGVQDHKIAGGDDVMSVGYDEFIAPLVRAVQELSAKILELEAKLSKV